MKKIKNILIMSLLVLILCSCETKDNHKLIELTAQELVQNIYSEEEKSIIFAIIDNTEDDTEQFIKDLKTVSNNIDTNIYYVDYQHLDTSSAGELFFGFEGDLTTNSYHVISSNELKLTTDYTDFKTLFKDLKEHKYNTDIITIPKSTKKEYINSAKKHYQEGNIGLAYEELNKAWNIKEAKEEFNNNKYYNLINTWESKNIRYEDKEENDTIDYQSILFYFNVNYLYKINKTGKYSEFKKPEMEEYKKLYYYVKDDIIYTSTKEDGTYKETYKIEELKKDYLSLTDLKNNKKYTYSRMV